MRSMPIRIVAALAAVLVMAVGTATVDARSEKNKAATRSADCPQPAASPSGEAKAQAPQKIEGEVTAVDPTTGALTLRAADGTVHQFRGNIDTLKSYKVGDHVQLSLRSAPNC